MSQQRIKVNLTFVDRNQLHIGATVGKMQKMTPFQLDTGCSYTQISTDTAALAELKGHPKLIGTSRIGDGAFKVDYICPGLITVEGVSTMLMFKVGPDQPEVFGLDAVYALGMILDVVDSSASILPKAIPSENSQFRSIDSTALFKRLGIQASDLLPIQSLPPPQTAYQQMVDAGQTNLVHDMGTTLGCSRPIVHSWDLGRG